MADTATDIYYQVCPVCSSPIRRWKTKMVAGGKYDLDLCRECGYCFINPRPNLEYIANLYRECGGECSGARRTSTLEQVVKEELSYPNSTLDARRIIKTIKNLAGNVSGLRLLDVGCGYGVFSKEALREGFEVLALEPASNERTIAEAMTGLSVCPSPFEAYECPAGSVAVVLMSQILEHAVDINEWMNKCQKCLSKDGIVAIAVPNYGGLLRIIMQEREPFICPPYHLNFFSPRSLSSLLTSHGFTVESIQWISRIPGDALARRLPKWWGPMLPATKVVSWSILRMIDSMRGGMIINVYGKKRDN